MKITEVRIFPTESKDGKLKAFATMTFDDWFVVRNVKVIQGNNGLFVAMPSRKAMDFCPKCRFKNVVGSRYCNQCGAQLEQQPGAGVDEHETRGNHMDIAHPITQECREYIQRHILDAHSKHSGQQKEDKGRNAEDTAELVAAGKTDPDVDCETGMEENRDISSAGAEETNDKDIEL